ncbi:MAG TPA: helix-turn-helix domain-containing protein, partial [Rhizomicrobium sp.]|nr:helix-turn-helix domain-containing protein [Rhizomicrobium sp.]
PGNTSPTLRLSKQVQVSDALVRPSARVSRVADLLDCDESEVRRLIDGGELQAHGLGKRGVRVFLDSVAAYQAVKHRITKSPVDNIQKSRKANRAAQISAENELRKSGILQ